MYKNLQIIYQNLGEKNLAIGIIGRDEKELNLLLNSFFNYGLIKTPEYTEESENFRYIIVTHKKLNDYLFLSSLFQYLNENNQELDSNNEPNIVQKYHAQKIAQKRFNSWTNQFFYPFDRQYIEENRFEPKDQDFFEDEKLLMDNMNYEIAE